MTAFEQVPNIFCGRFVEDEMLVGNEAVFTCLLYIYRFKVLRHATHSMTSVLELSPIHVQHNVVQSSPSSYFDLVQRIDVLLVSCMLDKITILWSFGE